jgi:hypothetical protein
VSDPISNPPVSPEEIKAFYAANPRPVLPPLSEMRNMTPDEREEFDRMSRADVRPIARSSQPSSSSEIKEALSELEAAHYEHADWNRERDHHDANFDWSRINVARIRLESLYREQLQEIERLRESARWADNIKEATPAATTNPKSGFPCARRTTRCVLGNSRKMSAEDTTLFQAEQAVLCAMLIRIRGVHPPSSETPAGVRVPGTGPPIDSLSDVRPPLGRRSRRPANTDQPSSRSTDVLQAVGGKDYIGYLIDVTQQRPT